MKEPLLPELPPTITKFSGHTGERYPLWEEHQMRAFGLQCFEAGREAERERCTDEIEAIRTNDRAVNLTAGEIMRNEIADDLLAAIREGTKT